MKNKLSNYDREEVVKNFFIWHDGDELVATVRIRDLECAKWICGVYVSPKYRKQGLCYALLDVATMFGGRVLSVYKTNKIAKHAYEKYGFKVFDENDKFYYLKLKEEDEMSEIKTYDEMNKQICGLLRLAGDNVSLYAAQRITELEAENADLTVNNEVLQRDVDNLTRTLEEGNEEYQALQAEREIEEKGK